VNRTTGSRVKDLCARPERFLGLFVIMNHGSVPDDGKFREDFDG
jgi:hypothetical protein